MYIQFLEAHYPYKRGEKIYAGPGHNMGSGVAKVLLDRKIVDLIPDEPVETEPRPPRKAKRA